MALCVESKPLKSGLSYTEPVLVVSEQQDSVCTTYYLVEADDLQSQLSSTEVAILFSAAALLYAVVFVFKLSRRQFGF